MANNTIYTNTGTYGSSSAANIGPLMQGQAGVVMRFTVAGLDGTAINLTGLTITGTITNNQTNATGSLAGAIALVTPASGIFSWTTDADDVGTAGEFTLIFTIGSSMITLPAHLSIVTNPSADTTFVAALVGVTVAERAWLTAALAALPDAGDLANVPDPAGATASYVWTADGANGADWAAAASGVSDVGDLTTTTGNSTEMVRVAAAGGLEYRTPAEVLSDIGAAASSSLSSYLPKTAGSGQALTGALYLDPGSDDSANVLRIPTTDTSNGDILFNVNRVAFNSIEDVIFNWGFNNPATGGKLDAGLHAWYLQLENNYNFAGANWVEYHLNLYPVSGDGFRPMQFQYKVDGSQGILVFKTTTFQVLDLAGTDTAISIGNLGTVDKFVSLYGVIQLLPATGNANAISITGGSSVPVFALNTSVNDANWRTRVFGVSTTAGTLIFQVNGLNRSVNVTGGSVFTSHAAGTIPLLLRGASGQTGSLIQARDTGDVTQFAIGPTGQIWTNQAAANTATPSGATAYQLPIYNAAGTLLGYIPVYGASWT